MSEHIDVMVEDAPTPQQLVELYLKGEEERDPGPVPFTVRLYPGTLQALQGFAQELGVPRSQLVRQLLEGALAQAVDRYNELTGGK